MPPVFTEDQQSLITSIVSAVVASTNAAQKSSTPKVNAPMLSGNNYPDWCSKMFYALSLNNLWIDPKKDPQELSTEEQEKNRKALLFMACHLDEQNSAFVNSTSKCFITAWNAIKKFHEPRTATILSDIHLQIQKTKHKAGQSIEKHLMLMETQFTRLQEIGKSLDEAHYVALILASIHESGEFGHIFHSALWCEENSISLSKVKSALISSQHHMKSAPEQQAFDNWPHSDN